MRMGDIIDFVLNGAGPRFFSERDLVRLFKEPRYWRRGLRLAKPFTQERLDWNIGRVADHHRPEVVHRHQRLYRVRGVEPDDLTLGWGLMYQETIQWRRCLKQPKQRALGWQEVCSQNTVGTQVGIDMNAANHVRDSITCSDGGNHVRVPGFVTWLKTKSQIIRRFQETQLNKVHHEDLYWFLKMHAFGLPRTDSLIQSLRQRAIRFLELRDCKRHSMKEHSQVVTFVVTQVMIESEDELLLKDIMARNFSIVHSCLSHIVSWIAAVGELPTKPYEPGLRYLTNQVSRIVRVGVS